jgi:hypothetical protein
MIGKSAAKPARSPWRSRILLLAVVGLALVSAVLIFRSPNAGAGRYVKLNALPSQQIAAFGDEVLYYDGIMLHCINASGGRRWSFQIGQGAGFHTNGTRITAWSANQFYIINRDGRALYNDRMSAQVQFARVGNTYVAAFVGEQDSGSIIVVDSDGKTVETLQVVSTSMLDIGFFAEPELMWTLGLETTGTVPSTVMLTYDPGKLITGNAMLGEQLVYRVYYHNKKLGVVDTRRIRTYDYRIKEDPSVPSILIYGWHLQDLRLVNRELIQLLVPTLQLEGRLRVTDLRLLTEDNSRVLHLPAACVGAVLGSKAVFGFAGNYAYMCRYGETSFSAFTLPMNVTRVIGITQNDRAIVADNNDVYLVQLPR